MHSCVHESFLVNVVSCSNCPLKWSSSWSTHSSGSRRWWGSLLSRVIQSYKKRWTWCLVHAFSPQFVLILGKKGIFSPDFRRYAQKVESSFMLIHSFFACLLAGQLRSGVLVCLSKNASWIFLLAGTVLTLCGQKIRPRTTYGDGGRSNFSLWAFLKFSAHE